MWRESMQFFFHVLSSFFSRLAVFRNPFIRFTMPVYSSYISVWNCIKSLSVFSVGFSWIIFLIRGYGNLVPMNVTHSIKEVTGKHLRYEICGIWLFVISSRTRIWKIGIKEFLRRAKLSNLSVRISFAAHPDNAATKTKTRIFTLCLRDANYRNPLHNSLPKQRSLFPRRIIHRGTTLSEKIRRWSSVLYNPSFFSVTVPKRWLKKGNCACVFKKRKKKITPVSPFVIKRQRETVYECQP